MTAFLALRDTVRAQLQAIPALSSGRVTTDPGEVLAVDDLDDVVVAVETAQGERLFTGRQALEWVTDISVMCRARAASGQDAFTRADQILAAAWARLQALPPPPGVTDMQLQTTLVFTDEMAETGVAGIGFTVRFSHRTQPLNLEAAT